MQTKRGTRHLAASIAIGLALAAGGAGAVSVTYCQPEGTKPVEPIWGHELGGALTVEDEITTTPKLAFPGATLDELPAECSFFSSMYGVNINDKYAPVVGMHRQSCDTDGDGHIDKIALQMGVYDGGHTKCVIVVLTNGNGGVYVQRFCQLHKNNSPNMFLPYYTLNADGSISQANSPSSWNTTGNGYQLGGFKIRGTSPLKTSALAFPGKTVAELKDCAFVSAYRFGRAMGTIATNNFASFVTPWPSTGEPQKLVMQFVNLNDMQKTAIIEMTNGVDGVYAFQSHHAYNSLVQRFSVNAETGAVTGGSTTTDTPPNYAVHGLYALPLETVKLSPTKIKAFSNGASSAPLTLDDIKYGTFSSRMCGINVGASCFEPDSAIGYNKKVYEDDGGSATNIVVEFQVMEDSYAKCVVVSFENGSDGIYATALGARYTSSALGYEFYRQDGTWNSGISNQSLSENFGAGYGVLDLRVTVETATEWTLDQGRTWSELRNGATLAANEVVRIKVTGDNPTLTIDENVNVAKIEFVNGLASGVTTNMLAVSGGVSFDFTTLSLGERACLAVSDSFAPSAVSAVGSTLIYTSGTGVCATISGTCNVVVAPGATLFIDSESGISSVLNNGTVVKRVAAEMSLPFSNASTGVTVVSNGTLKASSKTGTGTAHVVRVTPGATFDMNGIGDLNLVVRLEEGAHFVNNVANIGNATSQAVRLALDGDATATAGKNFGLLAPASSDTFLELGSNTLTLDGTGGFWLCNTTITGDGTIAVESGTLQCARGDAIGENCTLNIGASAEFRIDGTKTFCVSNFCNGGKLQNGNVYGGTAYGTVVVNGTLTSGNALTNLTLTSGAAVKATGTVQVVSGTFTATGEYTVDASEISRAQLNAAEGQRVPVMTVPTADMGGVWSVANPPVPGCRAKWLDNGDGTSTLYVAKPIGLMVVFR